MSGAGVTLPRLDRGASLGRLGAIWGLAFSVALGARLIQVQSERPGIEVVVGVAFAALYVTPFALALYAARSGDPRFQIAVWTAAGVAGLALALSSLAGLTLVLLPASGLLLVGAWLRHPKERRYLSMRHVVLSMGLIGAAVASGFALIGSFSPRGAGLALGVWLLAGTGAVAVRRIDARKEGEAV